MSNKLRNCYDTFVVENQPAGEMLFGVELEVEFQPNNQQFANRNMVRRMDTLANRLAEYDNIMCKMEGSLVCGFEVITKPGTIDYYANEFDWSWITRIDKSTGICTTDIGEHGMHIHVSRSAFLDGAHIDRFETIVLKDCLFFYDTPWGSSFFAEDSQWARHTPQEMGGDGSRYHAVTRHDNSVEVRIFVPTLSPKTVCEYMSYVAYTIRTAEGDSNV